MKNGVQFEQNLTEALKEVPVPIKIIPRTTMMRVADCCMTPLMYLASGTFYETPQRTHSWNNRKLTRAERSDLDAALMVTAPGDKSAVSRWIGVIPIFHIPVLGGWRTYRVLEPIQHHGPWYLGWIPVDESPGISLVPATGKVRALEGPTFCGWFAVDEQGRQIPLHEVGIGHIGNGGPYAHLPLY